MDESMTVKVQGIEKHGFVVLAVSPYIQLENDRIRNQILQIF